MTVTRWSGVTRYAVPSACAIRISASLKPGWSATRATGRPPRPTSVSSRCNSATGTDLPEVRRTQVSAARQCGLFDTRPSIGVKKKRSAPTPAELLLLLSWKEEEKEEGADGAAAASAANAEAAAACCDGEEVKANEGGGGDSESSIDNDDAVDDADDDGAMAPFALVGAAETSGVEAAAPDGPGASMSIGAARNGDCAGNSWLRVGAATPSTILGGGGDGSIWLVARAGMAPASPTIEMVPSSATSFACRSIVAACDGGSGSSLDASG